MVGLTAISTLLGIVFLWLSYRSLGSRAKAGSIPLETARATGRKLCLALLGLSIGAQIAAFWTADAAMRNIDRIGALPPYNAYALILAFAGMFVSVHYLRDTDRLLAAPAPPHALAEK